MLRLGMVHVKHGPIVDGVDGGGSRVNGDLLTASSEIHRRAVWPRRHSASKALKVLYSQEIFSCH